MISNCVCDFGSYFDLDYVTQYLCFLLDYGVSVILNGFVLNEEPANYRSK